MKAVFFEQSFDSNLELKEFENGLDMDTAYNKFGDEKIRTWLRMGEILLLKRRFVLLK